jgi:8-oxo-dGTP pyrophosphatase MutT (NUDIX family)
MRSFIVMEATMSFLMRTGFLWPKSRVASSMDRALRDFFLSEGPLAASDASVAIIVLDDARYLMQLRDQRLGIFFPGHWGFFGGAIEPGEHPDDALRRELFEELGYRIGDATFFTRFSFDFSYCGYGPVLRHYYEVKMEVCDVKSLTLTEGSELRAFEGRELLRDRRITPYDSFALWMHMRREA